MLKLIHKLGMALIGCEVAAIVPHSVATPTEEKMASGQSYVPPRMNVIGEDTVLVLLENGAHIVLPGTVETVAKQVADADEWVAPKASKSKSAD